MLAQRQPSFKECVTAHWSSCSAPKIIGAQTYHRSYGFIMSLDIVSGRGTFCCRLKVDREDYWTKQKRLCRYE